MDWLLPAPEQTDAFDTLNFLPSIMFFRDDAEWAVQEDVRLEERNLSQRRAFALPATRTLYGFKLDQQTPSSNMPRSNEKVRTAIQFPNGNLAGYVELSEGPAYGAEIVSGVASAWVAASVVAVCIAGGVGLLISRRMSQPLVALTDVTARMAGGDLSARARIYGVDEAGILAQSFNGMAARVEDTILTLRRFVADAAHELHTPLTALRTNLELAVLEENERLTYIERAQSQVLRLETLTSDLLELSRLEAHVVQTHRNVVNLTQLSHEMGELYASQAEQKGIDFTLDMPEADVKVVADAPKIQRALDNLLQNAIKFTPSGGTIRLGVRRSADWIDIWVQDDGIGIPTDDLTQLFSRFHRGRNAATYPGSGLGLAIVKAIAEYHHGQVIAENCRPGARLSLRLPAPT
jgi:two-component system OmpR family sensor kinase